MPQLSKAVQDKVLQLLSLPFNTGKKYLLYYIEVLSMIKPFLIIFNFKNDQ